MEPEERRHRTSGEQLLGAPVNRCPVTQASVKNSHREDPGENLAAADGCMLVGTLEAASNARVSKSAFCHDVLRIMAC